MTSRLNYACLIKGNINILMFGLWTLFMRFLSSYMYAFRGVYDLARLLMSELFFIYSFTYLFLNERYDEKTIV